jgi:hypothetical protein
MSAEQPRKSLFAAIMEHLDNNQRTPAARRENLEMGLGFLGALCLFALVSTVAAELRGELPLLRAVVCAVLVGMTYLVYRSFRKAGGWGP